MAERLLEQTDLIIDHLYTVSDERPVWSVKSADSLELDLHGIPGDCHYGPTRTLRRFHSTELAGREVINDRQLLVAQAGDMVAIAEDMGLPVDEIEQRSGTQISRVMAELLAVNVLFESADNRALSTIAASGLTFVLGNNPNTAAAMKLSEYSRPCFQPVTQMITTLGKLGIDSPMNKKEMAVAFKEAAKDGRGWLGSVYAAGTVRVGETASVYRSLEPKT